MPYLLQTNLTELDQKGPYHFAKSEVDEFATIWNLKTRKLTRTAFTGETENYYISPTPSVKVVRYSHWLYLSHWMHFLLGLICVALLVQWNTYAIALTILCLLYGLVQKIVTSSLKRREQSVRTYEAIDADIKESDQRIALAETVKDVEDIKLVNRYQALVPLKRQLDNLDLSILDDEDKQDAQRMIAYIEHLGKDYEALLASWRIKDFAHTS